MIIAKSPLFANEYSVVEFVLEFYQDYNLFTVRTVLYDIDRKNDAITLKCCDTRNVHDSEEAYKVFINAPSVFKKNNYQLCTKYTSQYIIALN